MISITNKIKPISSQFNLFHEWKFGTLNIRSGKEKLEGARMYEITKEVVKVAGQNKLSDDLTLISIGK